MEDAMSQVGRGADSIAETWRVMQLVEANRHRAEQLEAAARRCIYGNAELLIRLARQRREIAEQAYDLWLRGRGEGAGSAEGPIRSSAGSRA
jgi:hypothetical protein